MHRGDQHFGRSKAVHDVAADWMARREAGLSETETQAFDAWLAADIRHAEAVAGLDFTWRKLGRPRATGQADVLAAAITARVAEKKRLRRRWITGLSFGSLATAAALMFFLTPAGSIESHREAAVQVAAITTKPERQTLPDGSVVEFNAGAEIEVNYTAARRDVRLVRGQAHFSVSKNAERPFYVTAGKVTVRAVGTAFDVNFESEQVGVVVTEGRVAVAQLAGSKSAAEGESSPLYLNAGSALTVPTIAMAAAEPLAPVTLSAQEMEAALAWRSLRVEFTDTPLREVVALFNRKNEIHLLLAEPDLGELRISGVFWANSPEGLARLLEASVGLGSERRSPTQIVLKR